MDPESEFEQGCTFFDAGEYFEAHEVWENLWHVADGPRHSYLQGLIQIAAALHHAKRENLNGARKLLARALGYLEKTGHNRFEIDIVSLRENILAFERAIQDKVEGKESTLPFFLLPRNQ